ncbi:hypothetical protein H310_11001 [Aphanomyces invadans]|uniref:Elicitin n=1 Tax=Aphanomyces invadans TaxID=157072 RepID=A0A024TNI1_9STRA|nr:hypothetical protein H310_11001 [Aphanomyces invadans]ETV95559.1 hypothetical protein H310_11001 [Aphanomyces invadans]|eukprot:XP_008875752.1 hypothetical protein H310_11001 [Aphanomyces invadans]
MYYQTAVLVMSGMYSCVAGQRQPVAPWSTSVLPMLNLLDSVKPCEYTTVVLPFLPYLVDIQNCTTDSNYTFVPPAAFPTAKQTQALCTKPTCTNALTTLQSLDMPNCTVPSPTGEPVLLDVLIRHIVASCDARAATYMPTVIPVTTMTLDDAEAETEPQATVTSSAHPLRGLSVGALAITIASLIMPFV